MAMQAISDAQKTVQELANAHGWWNTWSVRLVAATVVVTALYFVAQWMTNKRGNQLSEAQFAVAAESREKVAALNLRAEELAHENALLSSRVGGEVWTRKLIEDAIAPREIKGPQWAAELRTFPGTQIEVVSLDGYRGQTFYAAITRSIRLDWLESGVIGDS